MADDVSPEVLMRAAVREVDRLTKRSRRDRIIAGVVVAALIISVAGLWFSSRQQRQASFQACQNGNDFRRGEQAIWDDFLGLAVSNSKSKADAERILAPFRARVARTDAPRPCAQLYKSWFLLYGS